MSDSLKDRASAGTGARVIAGCGAGCMLALAAVIVLAGVSYLVLSKWVRDTTTELKDEGYESVYTAIAHELGDGPVETGIYRGITVSVSGVCSNSIAVIAQVCEISGVVKGDLYFRGQFLDIRETGVVEGDLDVSAQVFENCGTVEGRIRGRFRSDRAPRLHETVTPDGGP